MSKWISVKDKFPVEDGKYILCVNSSAIVIGSFVKDLKCFYKSKLAHISYGLEISKDKLFKNWHMETKPYVKVTHWMPLPELPKER